MASLNLPTKSWRITGPRSRTRLEQGGTYVDLNRLDNGPFKALGGHEASQRDRYVAKRDTDYELWEPFVGVDDQAEVERPKEGDR